MDQNLITAMAGVLGSVTGASNTHRDLHRRRGLCDEVTGASNTHRDLHRRRGLCDEAAARSEEVAGDGGLGARAFLLQRY